MSTLVFFKGMAMGAGLIMAIGAQNAHVLKMGLQRQHVALTVAVCALSDAVLIVAGIAGMGALIRGTPLLLDIARWGGAAFLFWYGLRAWRAALQTARLEVGQDSLGMTPLAALATVLAFTWLNPHVYLDTVVLLGSVGAQQAAEGKWWFAAGASLASVLWFSSLGFGARLLAPLFARPLSWRILDGLVGCMMWTLAAGLALAA